jgi:cyanophycinase
VLPAGRRSAPPDPLQRAWRAVRMLVVMLFLQHKKVEHMIFLHGGGDNPDKRLDTFGRFIQAATINSSCNLALVIAEATESQARASFDAYSEIFISLPSTAIQIHPVFVSATQPLHRTQLEHIQPSGVFVCGGSTPLYHQSLCLDMTWMAYLLAAKIPYGGTSAGTAIAARRAILGGWQATRNGETRALLFQGASEGLDPITVRDGLGLVSFAIDVHASQMGTLSRLLHAVELGLVTEGWAIDENTVLQIEESDIRTYGHGHAYRVWRDTDRAVRITIHTAAHLPGDARISSP